MRPSWIVGWMVLFGLGMPFLYAEDLPVHGVPGLQAQLDAAAQRTDGETPRTLTFPKGTYHFYFDQAIQRELYISNTGIVNPRRIGLVVENLKNVTLDGNGSELIFHGLMLPIVFRNCENCTLKNFHIDFADPDVGQVRVLENSSDGITVEVAPEHDFVVEDGTLFFRGLEWKFSPQYGMAFDGKTRHIVYRTSDIGVSFQNVREIRPRVFFCPNWKDGRLTPGTVCVTRNYVSPACGIFMEHDRNATLENLQIHYAPGKALVAQCCDGIHLNGYSVCLRGPDDPRFFTANADSTHFSGCKGLILVENGLFENMMDDAINVHGTYLKVVRRVDDRTLQGQYMHSASWGFFWGEPGDSVQFVRADTMELVGEQNTIVSLRAVDRPTEFGAKVFEIQFQNTLPEEIAESGSYGIENLTWSPEVIFRKNVIRNNRARGALFSTPRKTVVEDNLFDHVSGSAILLCGDCNGWFETGACRDVLIRRNRFVNALTSPFQFTNAVLSIFPEIPNLDAQKKYFHGGTEDAIRIEENVFETFDRPLVFGRSVSGVTFRHNTVCATQDFPPFHPNQNTFLFQRAEKIRIEENTFDPGMNPNTKIEE